MGSPGQSDTPVTPAAPSPDDIAKKMGDEPTPIKQHTPLEIFQYMGILDENGDQIGHGEFHVGDDVCKFESNDGKVTLFLGNTAIEVSTNTRPMTPDEKVNYGDEDDDD